MESNTNIANTEPAPDWDWDSFNLPPTRTSHQEIRDHYVALVDFLKRARWDSQRIADFLDVKRQTSYQYGFKPETRGSRMIPAEKLDRLRDAATEIWIKRRQREFPVFLNRDEHLWLVFAPDMTLVLETASPWLQPGMQPVMADRPCTARTTSVTAMTAFPTTTGYASSGSKSDKAASSTKWMRCAPLAATNTSSNASGTNTRPGGFSRRRIRSKRCGR